MRRGICLALFFGLTIAAAPAQAATLNVTPNGSDSGSCTAAAPCKTFARAFAVAAAGDVVSVAAGQYGRQAVSGSKAVTFRGTGNAVTSQLDIQASNTTWDNINVDAGAQKPSGSALYISGSAITYKNAAVGNVVDEKGLLISGANHTIDNVLFHDAVMSSAGEAAGVHMECVYAIGVPGITIRNSVFRDCSVMDLFFTYGSWWSPQPPSYGNVTVENNVFAHPERQNSTGWHYYSMYIAWIGPNGAADPMSNWVVRNNTFESDAFVAPDRGTNGTRFVGNVGSWDCKSGVSYSYNVGTLCGGTGKAVSPSSSTASQTAPFGWVNPGAYDFHLRSDSVAVNAGNPNDAPARDREGKARNGAPDAGAYEF